jgi:subtilase family serine protease
MPESSKAWPCLLTAALALTGGSLALASPAAASASAAPPAFRTVLGTQPGWAVAHADQGPLDANATIRLSVDLAGRNPGAVGAYAAAVSDPNSPDFGKFLTPAQFHARFGPTPAQRAAVTAWLHGAGLTITADDAHSVSATGTSAAAERAVGTRLDRFATAGQVYRAPVTDIKVPASLAGAVLTVRGLDDMPTRAVHVSMLGQESTPTVPGVSGIPAHKSLGTDGAAFLGPTPCSTYYGQIKDTKDPAFQSHGDNPYAVCGYVPSQLRDVYGVTTRGTTGAGVRVAIIDAYASPTMAADANRYATLHGDRAFAPGQYTETYDSSHWNDQDACAGPAGWAGEESLDVEAVHGLAPDAQLHYYGANSCNDIDFLTILRHLVDTHGADLVSDSWGEPVYSTTDDEPPPVMAEYTQLLQQAATEGIGVAFSAGDCGAEDPATACGNTDTSSTAQADFPSSDPWATSVGGNSLAIGKINQVLWTTAWGTTTWQRSGRTWAPQGWQQGGGGGTSAVYDQPAYQKPVVSPALATTLPDGTALPKAMRVTPDVAMDADPFTGLLFGMTQQLPDGSTGYAESAIGGTSLACPLFSAVQADLIEAHNGVPTGFANPQLYAAYASVSYRDVTNAGPGLSAATILPPYTGYPATLATFGDDQLLKAGKGYDDATGLGTPTRSYLWY